MVINEKFVAGNTLEAATPYKVYGGIRTNGHPLIESWAFQNTSDTSIEVHVKLHKADEFGLAGTLDPNTVRAILGLKGVAEFKFVGASGTGVFIG